MANDRPIASISGKHDWAWNRWQADQHSRTSPADAPRPRGNRAAQRDRRPRSHREADRRDIHELEGELDRTERRLQSIITRYERLLSEKNRQLNEGTDAEPTTPGFLAGLSKAVNRLVSR